MKNILFACTLLFSALAIAGGVYVRSTGGAASPGLSVICCVLGLSCLIGYLTVKHRERK